MVALRMRMSYLRKPEGMKRGTPKPCDGVKGTGASKAPDAFFATTSDRIHANWRR